MIELARQLLAGPALLADARAHRLEEVGGVAQRGILLAESRALFHGVFKLAAEGAALGTEEAVLLGLRLFEQAALLGGLELGWFDGAAGFELRGEARAE